MKRLLCTAALALGVAVVAVGSTASADTLYYDTSTATTPQLYQGTSSIWDASTTSDWTTAGNGATLSTWTGGSGTDAVFASTLSASPTVTVNGTVSVNSITISKTATFSAGTGSHLITLGAGGLNVTNTANLVATFNSGVLSGSGGVILDGSTAQAVLTSNSYTGQVQVRQGTMQTSVFANFGTASSLGLGETGSNVGRTSVLLGTTGSITGPITASTPRGVVNYTGAGAATPNRTFTLTPGGFATIATQSAAGNLTLNGVIDGGDSAATLMFASANTTAGHNLVLNVVNTYSGDTDVYGNGITQLGVDNALPTTTRLGMGFGYSLAVSAYFDLNGHNQQVAGLVKNAGATTVNVFNSSTTQLSTLAIDTTNFVGTDTYAGVIGKSGGDNLGLTKSGTGILSLTGDSTYAGETKVTGGTLQIGSAGSIASTKLNVAGGIFEVLAAADALPSFSSIAGSGTINTYSKVLTLASGGTLAPGNSAGVLTLQNDLNIASVGTGGLQFELAGLLDVNDKVSMASNALTISGLQFSNFAFTALPGFGAGNYVLFDAGSISGSLGGTVSGLVGSSGLSGTLNIVGNDLVLSVVPEPSTLALLVTGLIGLLAYAWRKRK